jgi:hypothetical protein
MAFPLAAGTTEDFELAIVVANCEQLPTAFPFQGGGCVPAEGTVIVVTTMSGQVLGTCIAEATSPETATCTVSVPVGGTVIVTEDVGTIPPGYAPTMNPQSFEVPATEPDGVFGGPVFLNLPAASASAPTAAVAGNEATEVAIVDEPVWWVVPFVPGWGNPEEGRLFFGAAVSNATSETVHVGLSFRVYAADGTPFPGCTAPGGGGPGVSTTVAPGETAFLRCFRTIVPVTLTGLQVTARLWGGDPVMSTPVPAEATEPELLPDPELSSPMETSFDAAAMVRTTAMTDTEVSLTFRFYDDAGVQVGTCEAYRVVIEPEVVQRVTCASPVRLDIGGPQPVRVEVDAFQPD